MRGTSHAVLHARELEDALATARIGLARYVLEDVQVSLYGGTVLVTVYLRGQDPVQLRVARSKARVFCNALGRVLAQ